MQPSPPASILIIDEDVPLARSVQILLEDEGRYQVAVAPSSDRPLSALDADRQFNLLIVDLAVIDRHGPCLEREILDHHDNMAVIVMTAHEAALHAAHSRRLDAAGFLNKPIDPGTLLTMVSAALRDRETTREV